MRPLLPYSQVQQKLTFVMGLLFIIVFTWSLMLEIMMEEDN
jgi:4-hydroxybenzoate polyprenyltransferase